MYRQFYCQVNKFVLVEIGNKRRRHFLPSSLTTAKTNEARLKAVKQTMVGFADFTVWRGVVPRLELGGQDHGQRCFPGSL